MTIPAVPFANVRCGRVRVRVKARTRPVLTVVPFTAPAIREIMDILHLITERARKGEIDGIAIAATCRDQSITTAFHYTRLFSLMGAVATVDERLRRNTSS